jgi:hypothetical protein
MTRNAKRRRRKLRTLWHTYLWHKDFDARYRARRVLMAEGFDVQ